MKRIIKSLTSSVLIYSLLSFSVYGKEQIQLKDLVLPSEVKNMNKVPGSIYYSPSAKSTTLMPVHFWGEIKKSGLYYIPTGSTLVKGISLAGGITQQSKLNKIRVKREASGKIQEEVFDLSDGGDSASYNYKLHPGDTVFIEKDTHLQDRAFYTGLVSVFFTLLSSVVLLKEIKDN
jgi:hypothetical protein